MHRTSDRSAPHVPPARPAPPATCRTLELRCVRPEGCPRPRCGKLLLTVRAPAGPLPAGMTITRECPRSKVLLCEFQLEPTS